MIAFTAAVALATLAAGIAAAVLVPRLKRMRVQLVALALICVVLPLAAVAASGVIMFDSGHDLTVLALSAAASLAAVAGGLLLARAVAKPLDDLRATAGAIATGDLGARARESGPTEVAELAVAFNRMATNLEEVFDARRQLVAWASHDLRTPLASMQAMLEALEDGLAEPDHYLPAMREQVNVLSVLVDDLFELARIDAGALSLELREARLNPVVESCMRGLEAEAAARQVSLAAPSLEPSPLVKCAPESVERVLYNLLSNALRHTPSDGTVAVRIEPRAAVVEVAVEDTGLGLPPDSLERVFDRFWRADQSRTKTGGDGSGLGLAIARGLVEAQGGRIWAENRPEGGARIAFTLPAA
ncbi:MAG: sensor histidine kinase [Gaiellaceae bacterium]